MKIGTEHTDSFKFIDFERERKRAGEGQRERENPRQPPQSVQSLMQGLMSSTVRS